MCNRAADGFFGLVAVFIIVFITTISASAAINPQINFQGKITNPDGTNITNGSYSMRFRLYSDPTLDAANTCSANTCMWEETKTITVTDGIFQTALGDTTALPGSVDFNASAIYLGIKVGADAEMTPRVRFTASPYAFNADKVGGFSASQLVQLSPLSQQVGTINVSGSITTASTLAVQGSNALTLGSTANVGAILFQDGTVNNRLVTLNTPALAASYTLTLPANAPLVSQCVQSGSVTASQLTFGACGSTLQQSYNSSGAANPQILLASTGGGVKIQDAATSVGGNLFSVANNGGTANYFAVTTSGVSTAGTLSVNSGTVVPASDQIVVDNTGSAGVTTANANGVSVRYKGGAAAVEAAGMRIDYAPGSTSGGIWSGLHIVSAVAGPATGVSSYGIKLEGPTTANGGQSTAMMVASGWDLGIDLQSGGMQMADMSTSPASPAVGNLKIYSRLVAGRSMLSTKSSSGTTYALQPSLFQQNIFLVTPGTSTALNTTGGTVTTSGTLSTPTVTESAGEMVSYTSASNTTAAPAGLAGGNNQYFRGSVVNGANGFFYFVRINLSDTTLVNYTDPTNGTRQFYGLSDQTLSAMVASDNPLGNYAGFQFSASRDASVMQFATRNGSTQTITSTGVTVNIGNTYDLYIYSKPLDTTVYWRLDNLTDGLAPVEGSVTATLPTASTAMKPVAALAPLAKGSRILSFQRMYVETDR